MEVDPSNIDAEDPSASATLRYQAKKSEREDVQKRTFTKWINMRLVRAKRSPITDLFEDMKDGTVLMSLIEVLTGQNLNPEKGNTRVHHLNNVNHSIKFLEKQYNIKLVNICSDDVVNGNTKLILGLIWNLVLHWQIKDVMKVPGGDRPQSNLEKTLLSWCKECTKGYQRVNITNFTTSFRDGLAFNAIFHHFRPNDFSFEALLRRDNLSNLKHAFTFAEKTFNIEQILDPEDVNVEQPDKKSVLIYVMCCYQTLNRLSPMSHSYQQQFSPDSGSFVVTSPSSPPPFYDQISSPEEVPWLPREMPWLPQEMVSVSTSSTVTSTAPTTAAEISSSTDEVEKYQEALEGALVWLLQAKSSLSGKTEVSEDVKVVKRQFQEHEEFMIQLTEKQIEVGELFDWGNEMMRRSRLAEWTEKEIEAQMKLLNEQWEELRVHAMDKQTRLQRTLTHLQQKQLDDLSAWLERMENMMENSAVVLHSGSLQERVDAHKALQEEVESQQQQVSSLQNMVVVVDDANSDDAYEALEKQLENLGRRWAVVCRWVEESCANLKEGVTLWAEYEKRKEEFSAWLDSCESRLNDPKVKTKAEKDSEFKDIVTQVRELKSLELEMDRWMVKFDELSTTGSSLERHISEHEDSINRINHTMQVLKDRWDAIVKVMEAKSREIEDSGVELRDSGSGSITASRLTSDGSIETESIDALELEEPIHTKRIKMNYDDDEEGRASSEKMESVIRMTEENVKWLQEKVNDLPSEPARSSIELTRRRDSFKNLLEQLSQRESVLYALERDLDCSAPSDPSLEIKRNEVGRAWKELRKVVEDKLDQLSSTVQAVGRYNSVMKEEMRWQEQMSKILSRKPRPSGDAEELAEELDLLENLTSSRNSMNVEHLKELSSHLSSLSPHFHSSSLVASPPEDFNDFVAKNASLVAQAKERMRNLEDGISAAQSREGRIIDMTQWMAEVSATLQHHLEADLLAGDVPDEHNSLVQEFAEQEEFLTSLDGDVGVFRSEGKHEAADRLVQQIELLKKQFDEVKQKLMRFEKPPDFDSKMSLVRRVLEEINDNIQLLDVGGSRTEDIQSQLDHYQKFYKKMSELKPDVEYVVRTGRQVVDKKQVEFPNRLNSQIDAIKLQYNKLGSQVTTGKVSLEKCLRLSRKITKELENMRNLVSKIETRFASNSESRGLDRRTEEVVAIDSLLAEANNKKGIIPTLKDAVAQWARISVEGSMKEPSVDVAEVEEKLSSAIRLLQDRRNQLSAPRGGVESVPPANQRSTDFLVSPSLLTSVDRFLEKIKNADIADVEELKKLVREEDNFENEINLELKRLAKVKDDRKVQGDLEVAEQISNVVNNLQSRWVVCKSELKSKLQQQQQQQMDVNSSNNSSGDLVDSFNSDIDNISCWLDEAEVKVGSDGAKTSGMDELQLQTLKDQARQRKAELEVIARKIRSSKNPQLLSDTSPLLMRINRRLQKIQSSLLPASHLPPPSSGLSPLEPSDERRTPTTELRVQTPLERQIFFDSNGKPVSTALDEVRRMRRADEVDRRDEVFEANVETAPLYSRVTKPSNQKEERVARSGAEDPVAHKTNVPHKDWNIAMPDEMVQVEHHHHYHHQPTGPKQVQPSAQVVSGPQNKERFITGLNNFMSVIMEKAKPHSILIGSMNEIDEAVQKEKTKLQELQAMMPSIKTLVGKLELMQHDPDWSQNTKALTKRLCENWDKAMQDIKDRQMELVEMKDDGLKFEEEIEELERKMSLLRSNNNNNVQLNDLSNHVESVDELCRRLTNKYPTDDPMKIQSLANKMRSRWQQLSGRETTPEDDAEWKFNVDTKDLQLWLTRVELILGNLSEKESKVSGVSERNQLKTAAEDLKREVAERKSFIKSLSSTANQIVERTQDPEVPSQIQGQINDASNRWKRVKSELDDLILKLSEHQQQQQQQQGSMGFEFSSRDSTLRKNNQKLFEQLLATRSIEDALTNQPPISDELHNVRAQKASFQSLLDRINEQRPYVLSTLEREKNSADDKAKELSKELEKKWIRIQKMSADRAIELDAAIEKMTILQDSLDDLNQHLSLVEAESSSWLSVPELIKTGDVQREIMAVQAFQQKIAPIQGEVDQCNDAANQLGDAVASHRVVALLEDVTRRWRNLQLGTEERLSSLQNVSKRHGSFSQHILTASVGYPWERAVTSNNVPYYINHSFQSTHWDHPEMTRLVESLSAFDEVRFSAYRTAMKLRHLQKSLHLDCISLENLAVCLDSIPGTKFGKNFPSSSSSPSSPLKQDRPEEAISVSKVSTNNTVVSGSSFDGTPTSSLDRTKSFRRGEQLVGVLEIAPCLRLCFESLHSSAVSLRPQKDGKKDAADKKAEDVRGAVDVSRINVPLSMDLVLNWLLNVYDSSRNGMMRLSSFKTALVLMCNGTLEEKYKYLFKLSSGKEGLVDKSRLTRLLKDCIFLPRQLGEVASFGGTNVEPSVTSCFDKSGDKTSICEKDFLNWMKLEPQSLVWIPVLHRLKNSEEARHHVRCQCCKQLPLRGLRYRCHKCFSYDLCQDCFFAGKTTKNHKLSHPMQEYSSETTSSENVRDFTKVFKNKFRSKRYFQKHRRIGYLPVKISLESGEDDDDDDDELSPQNTMDDSTLLQRGITNSSSLRSHPDVFGTNSEEITDEHNLIAQYCKSLKGSKDDVEPSSPLQILKKLDAERREEVEEMIRDLENENKNLKAEYERLLRGKGPAGRPRNGWSERKSPAHVDDDDAKKIEEKLQVLDESSQHLQNELSQLRGTNLEENRGISPLAQSSTFGEFHTDNGIRELELDRMLQKLQNDDLPVNPGEANVSSLFREVEQINRAVETLVDIMTEGEGEDLKHRDRTNQAKPPAQKGGARFD